VNRFAGPTERTVNPDRHIVSDLYTATAYGGYYIRYTLQVKPFREQSQQSCIHRLSLMLGLLGLPCLI
jgi:hypothetical protein